MMSAVNGYYDGKTIVLRENIEMEVGEEVIVLFKRPAERRTIDLSQFVTPTERGKHVDEYMREMRDNDRI